MREPRILKSCINMIQIKTYSSIDKVGIHDDYLLQKKIPSHKTYALHLRQYSSYID